MRYDDEFDEVAPVRANEAATAAGLYGFIFSMVALGLLGVVVVLWILLSHENHAPGDERTLWMFLWFLCLDALAFIASLIAVILGARGVAPANLLYRGYSLAAVILGIVELVVSSFFGLFFFCCSLFLQVNRLNMG